MIQHRGNRKSGLTEALGVIALVSLAVATPALATRLRPLNLEELTQNSTRIVAGRCVEVRSERDPKLGRDVTLVTVEVRRTLKGEAAHRLKFKQLAGAESGAAGGGGVIGMPTFREGEEVILFLAGESSIGLASPLGLGQGKFTVYRDKQGQRLAVNEFGNQALFRGMSQRAAERVGPAAHQWEGKRGVDAEALLTMVESLRRPQ